MNKVAHFVCKKLVGAWIAALVISGGCWQIAPQTQEPKRIAEQNGKDVLTTAEGFPRGGSHPRARESRSPESSAHETLRVSRRPGAPVPESLFDAARNRFNPVNVEVTVNADVRGAELSSPEPIRIGGEEIITAAGNYGDMLRYMQVLPGIVATSDTNNEFLVRGGHPIENLFVVDGFEIPNLNHITRMGSSGGFAPMIDSGLVQDVTLHTGGYGAMYPDHLSSVTEINLLRQKNATRHLEGDLGIQGVGGLAETAVRGDDLLISGHHGLLDVVTRDAGLNGVPTYTNEMARYHLARSHGDSFTAFHIGGWDSIDVTPCMSDQAETSQINSQYSGWRETTGIRWQRLLSARSFRVFSVQDSEHVQHINQQDQYAEPTKAHHLTIPCPIPKQYMHTTPVYFENTNNAVSSAAFMYEWSNTRLTSSYGSTLYLQHPRFDILQPIGIYSPFSSDSRRTDATSVASSFSSGETGSFADLSYRGLKRLAVGFGSRVQTIAFGAHTTLTWRASARYGIGERFAMNAAFATYAQMPPYIYMVAFEQNRELSPMRAQHRIVGADFVFPASVVHVEAYDKPYSHTPVSSELPSVTLHSLPEQLTDEIVWLRMKSSGIGRSTGIEISNFSRMGSKLAIRSSLAYARAKFAGSDGVMRPSNYDLPWIFNLLATGQIRNGFGLSTRLGYATGRPYTPYDMTASLSQNRPIYDLALVNVLRSPYYCRVDGQVNKVFQVRSSHLQIYAGVDNLLNRQNFLSYAWMPISRLRYPVKELPQMPIFPNFGVRLILR
ncbi:MAG: TonB-dependent receptor [Acidobacteria bacterium]|nr:TonB-dependent receptor [Acidobacteriota bacterium]